MFVITIFIYLFLLFIIIIGLIGSLIIREIGE
uniref:Uncharacterized protein n=1 Tax=Anguilla anguilla TaxID=7936 RepID=A0A0E9Q8T0_ANGAN